MTPPIWPALPPEGELTEVEESFIENSPPDLWPDNQNTNFGQIRRVLTDPLQECIDFIAQLYFEMFVATSTRYLFLWEELAGVPINPTDLSIEARRAIVGTILKKGPFTRARRDAIIAAYLLVGFGSPIMLVPEGVPIPVEGLPIYDDFDPDSPVFRVVETVEDYYYSIRIRNGTAVDTVALTLALEYFQYAGLHFTIDMVVAPAVPQTPRRDEPTRADENPIAVVGPRGTWQGSLSGAGNRIKVVSNSFQAAASSGSAVWPEIFSADQEVYIKNVSNTEINLYLRLTDVGTATYDGYFANLKGGAGTTVGFYKVLNGTATLLASPTVTGYGTNEQWVFRAVGNVLSVYRNGFIEASIVDTAINNPGKIALQIANTGVNAKDFGGGKIIWP